LPLPSFDFFLSVSGLLTMRSYFKTKNLKP